MVLESARDSADPRPLVLTENRWAGRISSADYSGGAPRSDRWHCPSASNTASRGCAGI
ncbi:putative helicase helY domain protein [Mycobacterium kansasii 662]|uniref:Putative helicase helY domain protein n=1 Tax=Mycobacterium kansasii 662 TaxID=1299326 RepID=X7XQK2_MYCKA|nr:putative helicase helY domain protein [Mycobacterium kansasii 662]